MNYNSACIIISVVKGLIFKNSFVEYVTLRKIGGIFIWYVMYCGAENEENISTILQTQFADDGEVFVFTYEQMKRYKGAWHLNTAKLFPGYVFLHMCTERILTPEEQAYLHPVEATEEKFLFELQRAGAHLPMSKGYIQNGITYVTEGPLKGKETTICKIDRHKRLAKVKSPLEKYRERGLWAGLEIVSKN